MPPVSKMHKNEEYTTPLKEDIIQAHDQLTMFIRVMEEHGTASDEFVAVIYAHRDTLCWILGHRGTAFEKNFGNALDILAQTNKDNLN